MKRTIGVLGGMGPRATVYFEQKLLEQFTGSDQSLPRIVVVNDGAIPDRSAYLCGGGVDPLPALTASAMQLMALHPDLVCIPCNTAHAAQILGRLLAQIQLPIVDMPAAALTAAARQGVQEVMILGTEGTRAGSVYDARALNMRVRYPDTSVQATITELITVTKIHGFTPKARDALQAVLGSFTADACILACTELSMLHRDLDTSMLVIDALEALAAACAERASVTLDTGAQR